MDKNKRPDINMEANPKFDEIPSREDNNHIYIRNERDLIQTAPVRENASAMVIAKNAKPYKKQKENTRRAARELRARRGDKRKGGHSMDFGQIAELVDLLKSKDETKAYQCFKALEKESAVESSVYPFFDLFVEMTESDNSYIRTRGLLLIAANARWDVDNKIDEIIDSCLKHISDEKPITSRQFIKALPSIVKWKPDLRECIVEALRKANPGVYRESMRSLVTKDITWALTEIEKM